MIGGFEYFIFIFPVLALTWTIYSVVHLLLERREAQKAKTKKKKYAVVSMSEQKAQVFDDVAAAKELYHALGLDAYMNGSLYDLPTPRAKVFDANKTYTVGDCVVNGDELRVVATLNAASSDDWMKEHTVAVTTSVTNQSSMHLSAPRNCPNCGAPLHGCECEYCGTVFYASKAAEAEISDKYSSTSYLAHSAKERAAVRRYNDINPKLHSLEFVAENPAKAVSTPKLPMKYVRW